MACSVFSTNLISHVCYKRWTTLPGIDFRQLSWTAQFQEQWQNSTPEWPPPKAQRLLYGPDITHYKSLHFVHTAYLRIWHNFINLLSSSLICKNIKIKIYRITNLPVVLYGCEIWSITLREKHRLRVFKNRALRKILGPKRDEITGVWRKLHNEELYAL